MYQTFLAVLRTGSLSAAARELAMSQPTARRHVETLEQALGAILFTRSAGLVPTDAALPLAEEMQASARALERSLSTRPGPVAGRVRWRGEVELGLFASDGYVRAQGLPGSAADLARHALIGQDRGPGLETALTAAAIDPGSLRFAVICDNDAVQLAMLRAGAGIGACQLPIAARDGLVRVLPWFQAAMPVWLVMHEDLRAVPRVRAVFDHLADGLDAYLGRI